MEKQYVWRLWEQQMATVLMNRKVASVFKRQQRGQTDENTDELRPK